MAEPTDTGVTSLLAALARAGAESDEERRVVIELDLLMDWHGDQLAPASWVGLLDATSTREQAFLAAYDELFGRLDPDTLTLSAALCPLSLTNRLLFDAERYARMPNRAAYRAKVVARITREKVEHLESLMQNI